MENADVLHNSHETAVVRSVTQTARLMSEQAHMTPVEFLAKHKEATREAFSGSLDRAVQSGAIPVLICARDEEQAIGATLYGLSLSTIPVQPIVVDNGSTDQTAFIARSMGAEVITENNPGLIPALNAGFAFFKENGYHGAILHTDADSVPLSTWAETMTNYAKNNFSEGGHAYGHIIHYDGLRDALKNGLLTIGNRARNVLAEKRGINRVHVRNGVILTGDDDRYLDLLSNLSDPEKGTDADRAFHKADMQSGKLQTTCKESRALVVTSGRRHENIRTAIKATVLPRRFNQKTFREKQDGAMSVK